MPTIDYAKELNGEQLKVVQEGDGFALVLAGAGSGKTRTLVYRVAYLLEHGVDPSRVLLVTFTNKASKEMLHRIDSILGGRTKGLWGGTFHHLGNRLLRMNSAVIGYPPNFTILDSDDSQQLVKSVLGDLNIKPDKYFPKPDLIRDIISFAYNSQKPIDEVILDRYRQLSPDIISTLQTINQQYQSKKRQLGMMDFDDLLTNWYLLLHHPDHGPRIAGQFQYVLVDEYQDTNKIQGSIVTLLAGVNKNLLVVGDDAQSIYSFRAATVSNILDFPKQFSGAKVFKLETNYRSTPEILDLANASIGNNSEQFAKALKSVKGSLMRPILMPVRDNYQQAEFVVDRILELRQQGYSLNDMAILSRSTYQNIELELEINKRQIHYEVRGGLRFFEQAHIKDVVAFLRVMANPLDELAWKRILGLQTGIGPTIASRVWQTIAGLSGTVDQVVSALREMVLPGRADDGLKGMLAQLTRIIVAGTASAKITAVLSGPYQQHLKATYENASDRI
ncbi:UvrD-helicase domain-containing protein, partial [Candidatus Uhrbacteria bacterium]|nr:UvrD-helicase domain-containing protein [Candidatus Uhrbacteria bacterium]